MSSFEWMELQGLTNDIELSRSRLIEARRHGDRGRARALGEEIAQAEKSRLKLLAHISTNIVTTPEPASKTTEGPGFRQAVAAVAKAEPKKTEEKPAAGEPASAPEPILPPKPREGASSRHASTPPAEAVPDEGAGQPPPGETASNSEPPLLRKATEAADFCPTSAKTDSVAERIVVWDQLTPSDIQRAQNELSVRRAEVLVRHTEDLRELDAEQDQLETLEHAIDALLSKINRSSPATSAVKIDQGGQLHRSGGG